MRDVCRGLGWLLLLALLVVQIWGLYLYVPGAGEPSIPGQDKLAHGILFGLPFGLALLLRSRAATLAVVAHALASEPLQGLFTATRAADPWDVVADLAGIALAGAAVLVLRSRAHRPVVSELDAVEVAR